MAATALKIYLRQTIDTAHTHSGQFPSRVKKINWLPGVGDGDGGESACALVELSVPRQTGETVELWVCDAFSLQDTRVLLLNNEAVTALWLALSDKVSLLDRLAGEITSIELLTGKTD